ncbi:phosphoribosyltransferase family protein [Bacillus sp. 31A1R]|uniref:Phosphoribosyltransferase family protein n=1 Tax=Robertmurraya mangrovi TaxID=3098077 RepID=A0ABU5J145_9BACI|nr:phosphoribosyltransferase family protein [Bacillus sp. 31A1R]MDZ5473145.1 phosphoribosyltransferase family protein [Bacillus sp. 31A1R]
MNTHTLTFLNKKVTLPIINDLKVELTIQENPYSIPLDELFLMAARINKNRSFLFVSKVLGKHIPINPKKGLLIGSLLAGRYLEIVENKAFEFNGDLLSQLLSEEPVLCDEAFISNSYNPLIIGFAETATALGHAFFNSFETAHFFHTTREQLVNSQPVISFEEEHSHATSHRCYIDESIINHEREIILVDDEITTGKTALNIIRSIHEKFPRNTYTVVSILDWRSDLNVDKFLQLEKELGITIRTVSLIKGTVDVKGELSGLVERDQVVKENELYLPDVSYHYFDGNTLIQKASINMNGELSDVPYLKGTGRFGINSYDNQEINSYLEQMGMELRLIRTGTKTLCLGNGEFMYLPMKLAAYMGENVFYHSTTRSPIYPNNEATYGAKHKLSFFNPEDLSIQNFVYNIGPEEFDELFLFFEREIPKDKLDEFLKELNLTKIEKINIVFFSKKLG